MSDTSSSQDIPLPSYVLRVKAKHGNVIKSDIGLVSRDEEDALREIKKLFELGNKEVESNWELYYLARISWILPVSKGSSTIEEEALLEIKKEKEWNYSVIKKGDFIKAPSKL